METQPIPETMLQAVRQFSDPQVAHDFFVQIRFPNGVACPRMGCGSARVAYLAKNRRWYCNECKRQFSAKVGTIFEDSPIGFDKWLPAIWLLSSNRNGISSLELSRALGITQKSTWFMLHRIREAMTSGSYEKLSGPVEVDETYLGPKFTREPLHKENRRKSKGPSAGKAVIMGIVERKGKVRAKVVPNAREATLIPHIKDAVEAGAIVYTDALLSYKNLPKHDYVHFIVNHAYEYVRGHVHTNSIEGFWAVFKRTVRGTYIAPRPQHLQRYVDEQVFRFNAREDGDGMRFSAAAKGADGKRLTYKALIGKPI